MERRAVTGNFACQGSLDITIKTNQQSPELPFYFLLTLEKSEDTFIFDIKGNRHRIQVLHPGGEQLGEILRHLHTQAQKDQILTLATFTCTHLKTIGKLF